MKKELTVPQDSPSSRADLFVSETAGLMPRNQLKSRNAVICLNGEKAKFSTKVKPGDTLSVEYDELPVQHIAPEKTDLDIIFEDGDVIVLNKQRGMVVHPANGHFSGTLAQGLAWYLDREMDSETGVRTGIVHRLDKDTSGVIITAKNVSAHEFLSAQFKKRTCSKMYLAIVRGHIRKRKGSIENNLSRDRNHRKRFCVAPSGKFARTSYKVLRYLEGRSLVALYLHTGRTHQLRVHMKHIGHPIEGDPVYSSQKSDYPLMLHAYRLKIRLPSRPDAFKTFRARLPEDFKKALVEFRINNP